MLLLRFLRQLGLSASVEVNGAKAVEAVRRDPFDLVFMDVHMPVMDGLEATKQIIAEHGHEKRPLIVALTASAMSQERARCFEAGMDDFLSKPIRLDDIRGMLRKWCPDMVLQNT